MLVLLACAVFPSNAARARAFKVAINEVHYHPADDLREGEFVELHNYDDSEPADLGGWLLLGGVRHLFPEGTNIPPGGFLVVARSRQVLLERYGLDPAVVAGEYDGSLSNGGERLSLWSGDSYLVSFVEYSDGAPWPETPDGLGPSLERISPLTEESDPEAWKASIVVGGTPGAPNSVRRDLRGPPPASGETSIVRQGAVWRYRRGTDEPPASWPDPGFDDSAWESGPAGFGYGDGDDATLLDDMEGSYLTLFLRRSFEVGDPSLVSELDLEVDYDDGFIAYLNGVEVARANVAGSSFDDPASTSHEAGTPESFSVAAPASVLREGANVIAIQGHNVQRDSSDFSLAPTLEAVLTVSVEEPEGPPPPPPRDLVINEVRAAGGLSGWVELHNPTSRAIDVSGRRLEVFPPSSGSYPLPPGTVLPAGGFLLLAEEEIGFDLDLGRVLILATGDGRFIDGINPRTLASGTSTGRYPDGAENRVVFDTPTPEGPNAHSPETRVVINEIMYRPALESPAGEWLELHNRSDGSIDIGGWRFTRGIGYGFAPGTTLPPGGFLVLAADPPAVEAHYGITGVLGPYDGRLQNDAETLLLRDDLENVADRVRYADEGSFPESPDGEGPSLELIHPDLENRYGPAWRASDGEGTPGGANSALEEDPAPVVAGVEHAPVIPKSSEPVRVIASASDDRDGLSVTLHYLADGGAGPFAEVAMADDGIVDDGVAGNGIYGGTVPPQPDLQVTGFWIRARAGGQETVAPEGAPDRAFLYQVEDEPPADLRPLLRLILTRSDLDELRTRNTGSNELLDVTVVAGGKVFYNRGIRHRGSSARRCDPLSFRIQFDHDVDFHGIKRLNLNGCNVERQWIGLDFLRRTSIPTPAAWFRRLSFNRELEPDFHLRVEAIDDAFLERRFPDDADGNLYRGSRRANLDYRGEDFDPYRSHYEKVTNERIDDYSDIVDLSFRLDDETTSDEDFPAAVEERIDVSQWAHYFAVYAVLGSTENSIVLNNGDDYFLYHRFSDDRWILLPWDLDSVFNEEDQRLFRPTVDSIARFLRHPRYAPDYWCSLESLVDGPFRTERVESRIDHLEPLVSRSLLQGLRSYARDRQSFLLERLTREITVEVQEGGALCDGFLVPSRGTVSLGGSAPGCATTSVTVNGEPASYDPVTARWNATVDVTDISSVPVVARYRDGIETARLVVPIASGAGVVRLPEEVDSSLTLTAAGGPYVAETDVTVAPGATLVIEGGTTVVVAPGATLRVEGRLRVLATEADPAVLAGEACDGTWGGIVFLPGSSRNELRHVELRRATGAPDRAEAITVDGADLVVESLRIEGGDTLIGVRGRGSVEVSGSLLSGAERAVFQESGHVSVTGTVIRDMTLAAIETDVAERSSLALESSTFESCAEGVLSRGADVTALSCHFHDIAGSAVKISDASAVVERSVFERSGTALAVTDGGIADVRHVTIHDCGAGIRASEAEPGAGAALALVESSIIWRTPVAAAFDPPSIADLAYSDTEGGALAGIGNISADPRFRSPRDGDFRLGALSPCRGAGRGGSDMGAFPYEVLGETRRFRRCDGNGDGSHDLSDAVHSLLFLFAGGRSPACSAAADCNGDRRTDITDAVFSLAFLFQNGASPPGPYPACEEAEVAECGATTCVE